MKFFIFFRFAIAPHPDLEPGTSFPSEEATTAKNRQFFSFIKIIYNLKKEHPLSLFRIPTIPALIYGLVWLGSSIVARKSWRAGKYFFSYLAPLLASIHIGAICGGLLGESSTNPSDWGAPLIGMIVGAILGIIASVYLGRQAIKNSSVYYAAQIALVTVTLFMIPLF